MDDPAPTKRLIELAKKIVDEYTFTHPGRDPTRTSGVVHKLREVWKRYPDFRLVQLVFNVSQATQPCLEIFYLEDDVLLLGFYSWESREQSVDPDLQAELIRRYPRFFRKLGNRLIDQETSNVEECFVDMAPINDRGIECGDGWFAIVDRLCSACENEIAVLISHDVDEKHWPRVAQIKEKMGGLRFYVKGLISDQLRIQILQAEDDEGESYRTCERCGAAGKLRDGSWKHTYCDSCEADFEPRLRQ